MRQHATNTQRMLEPKMVPVYDETRTLNVSAGGLNVAGSQHEVEIPWYRTPIGKEKLRDLTRRSDWRGFLQVLPHLALVVLSGAAAFYAAARLPWWTLLPISSCTVRFSPFSRTAFTS